MKTTQLVPCTVPTLEAVEVEYNMMASLEACDEFVRSMARRSFEQVVANVANWPEELYPGGPTSDAAPMAWRIWLVRIGFVQATQTYAADPN